MGGSPGLVGVLDRGLADRLPRLVIRTAQGLTHLGFHRGDGTQGGRHLEDRLDNLFHTPSANVMTTGEVRHRRGHARPEDMGTDLRRDQTTIDVATARTGPRVPLMLGDDGRQFGEFADLMPSRLGVVGSAIGGQGSVAVVADRRHMGHDLVDPLRREAMAMMSLVPRLPPRLTSRRRLHDRLGRPGWIDRRRRRGVRGIAFQLSPQFVEFGL